MNQARCAPGQMDTRGRQVLTSPCGLASALSLESIRSLGRKPLLPAKVWVDAARGSLVGLWQGGWPCGITSGSGGISPAIGIPEVAPSELDIPDPAYSSK